MTETIQKFVFKDICNQNLDFTAFLDIFIKLINDPKQKGLVKEFIRSKKCHHTHLLQHFYSFYDDKPSCFDPYSKILNKSFVKEMIFYMIKITNQSIEIFPKLRMQKIMNSYYYILNINQQYYDYELVKLYFNYYPEYCIQYINGMRKDPYYALYWKLKFFPSFSHDKQVTYHMKMSRASHVSLHSVRRYRKPTLNVHLYKPFNRSQITPKYTQYYEMHLPKTAIRWVDHIPAFKLMMDYLTSNNIRIIGLDCEWVPVNPLGTLPDISLLQISTHGVVFLIDMVELCQYNGYTPQELKQLKQHWMTFMSDVLGNKNVVKLGFSIMEDLTRITNMVQELLKLESSPQINAQFGRMNLNDDINNYLDTINTTLTIKSMKNILDLILVKQHFQANLLPYYYDPKLPISTPQPQLTKNTQDATMQPLTNGTNKVTSTMTPQNNVRKGKRRSKFKMGTIDPSSSLLPWCACKGLSQLIHWCFGKCLDKTEQQSDWSQRPLRDAQIYYAALDSYCLINLYEYFTTHFFNPKNLGGKWAVRDKVTSIDTNATPNDLTSNNKKDKKGGNQKLSHDLFNEWYVKYTKYFIPPPIPDTTAGKTTAINGKKITETPKETINGKVLETDRKE